MKIHFIIILNLFTLFLTSCTSLNSNFDCPMKPGVTCRSLDQVNKMVDEGRIGQTSTASYNQTSNQNINFGGQPHFFNMTDREDTAIRHPEKVMRLWISPYEDTEGNYHEENMIYTVVKPGYWMNQPIQALAKGE